MRAGRAVVSQLLLRLDDAQQAVDDVVVESGDGGAGGGGGRGRAVRRRLGRRLRAGPQVPSVSRPAVPYADARALCHRQAQDQQQRSGGHGDGGLTGYAVTTTTSDPNAGARLAPRSNRPV